MTRYYFNDNDLYDMGFLPLDAFGDFAKSLPALKASLGKSSRRSTKIERLPLIILPKPEVVFPGQFHATIIDRHEEIELLARIQEKQGEVFLITESTVAPSESLYGCYATVIAVSTDPYTQEKHVLFGIGSRGRIEQEERDLENDLLWGVIEYDPDGTEKKLTKKDEELLADTLVTYRQFLEMIDGQGAENLMTMLLVQPSNWIVANFIAMHAPGNPDFKNKLLSLSVRERTERLLPHLFSAAREIRIKAELMKATAEGLHQSSRDNFLRHELQAIKTELGETADENTDAEELRARAQKKEWSKETEAYFEKELTKMTRFNVSMPEYSIQYSYLDTLLNLPWQRVEEVSNTLPEVREMLEKDHYGIEKVKQRIIEHVAVTKLRGDMKSPILCLYGPPGVGKTSLGKSIANALGREYFRVSLGGVSDEAEIRGHRRTYVGAMCGRIMAAMAKCKSNNPVIVLDEIDKIGKGLRGDPAQALLEVLDPEQNATFHDNYIDVDYDLSNVFFIATANSLADISEPLLDRMEVIEITGYVIEEKTEIALRHLIPKLLKSNGFQDKEIGFSRDAVRYVIENYTRESGVRQLEKKLGNVLRKIACKKVEGSGYPAEVGIEEVREFLGKEEVFREAYTDNSFAGVVTGLAWTSAGGEILFIETSVSSGKGEKLTLTGKLGDVMKESATIALEYLRANARRFGIPEESFHEKNLHIHVPEGAVPKDGPSAGIAMATSIASALTRRKVRDKLAMTGEMTLRGKVLPVGGIKEKILAAKRAGIREVILCDVNRKDVEEIPERYLEGLTFRYVTRLEEVLDQALLDELAE